TDSQKDYFPIPISLLQINKILDFDLYLRINRNKAPVLYRSKRLPISENDMVRLREQGIETLYIRSENKREYKRYLETHLREILSDNNVPVQKRTEVLYSVTTQAIKEMLDDPRSGELLPRSRNLVENTLDFIFHEPTAFKCMLRVTKFDYYTHTHSVNVGIFSVFLAKELNFPDDELLRFGIGSLLHDIGKCQVDPNIVNFPGKLSEEQFEQMKKHPEYGYKILTQEQGLKDELQLDVVLHHHEKLTGNGYPDKLKGDEISIYARVSAIADIFDALTTRRSYKNAFSSFDALKLMKEKMSDELDPQIFKKFVLLMSEKKQK
ncbi:MAG: HD-GYP domain-containing protein, partial [Candidatus Hydrogenedens sp.]